MKNFPWECYCHEVPGVSIKKISSDDDTQKTSALIRNKNLRVLKSSLNLPYNANETVASTGASRFKK